MSKCFFNKIKYTTMAQHSETGVEGEKLAGEWLAAKGFKIKELNWRYRHWGGRPDS